MFYIRLIGSNNTSISTPVPSDNSWNIEGSLSPHASMSLDDEAFFASPDASISSNLNSSDEENRDDHFELPSFENNPELFKPVYSDSSVSLSGAVCAIMQFCIAHELSYTAMGELLKLLQLLCLTPNLLPTTVYQFKKFFQHFKMPYQYSNVCSTCNAMNNDCHCDHPAKNSHLVHIPVEKSLCAVLLSKLSW